MRLVYSLGDIKHRIFYRPLKYSSFQTAASKGRATQLGANHRRRYIYACNSKQHLNVKKKERPCLRKLN